MSRESEFTERVNAWQAPLFRFACSPAGNREDALELTRSTLLKWTRNGGILW